MNCLALIMKFFFLFLLSLIGTTVLAQDEWKIYLDKKVLLGSSTEDEEKNVITILPENLRSKKFIASYQEKPKQKDWQRSILIYDEKNKELVKQSGNKLELNVSKLNALLNNSKTLKIYTISLPKDPRKQAQVRVRRVHLCTLVLQ